MMKYKTGEEIESFDMVIEEIEGVLDSLERPPIFGYVMSGTPHGNSIAVACLLASIPEWDDNFYMNAHLCFKNAPGEATVWLSPAVRHIHIDDLKLLYKRFRYQKARRL